MVPLLDKNPFPALLQGHIPLGKGLWKLIENFRPIDAAQLDAPRMEEEQAVQQQPCSSKDVSEFVQQEARAHRS